MPLAILGRSLMTLTNDQHYERYLFLRQAWNEHTWLYSPLLPSVQQVIHTYYRPSEDLTVDELTEHRRQAAEERPDLPYVAGRAFEAMSEAYRRREVARQTDDAAASRPRPKARGRDRKLRIQGILKPEPDLKKLAGALIELAEENVRQSKEQQTASSQDA